MHDTSTLLPIKQRPCQIKNQDKSMDYKNENKKNEKITKKDLRFV